MSTSRHISRWFHRQAKDNLKTLRRQARRALLHPGLAVAYAKYRRAVSQRDWATAKKLLVPLAGKAISSGDTRLVTELAHAAERLDEHELSTRWAYVNAGLMGNTRPTDWKGEDISDATLIVSFRESDRQGISIGLEMTGYVAAAARRSAHCILIVEKRLVPLFARSLPGVEVVAYPCQPQARGNTRLVTANALILKAVLGTLPVQVQAQTRPMLADAASCLSLRRQYQRGRDLPLVGLAWWSSHYGKDLPAISHWAELAKSTNAIFVVVQYGDVREDIEALAAAVGPDRLIVDEGIDQMRDMDRFASQLCALDGLITISNSGAHLAGALQVPTLLIRDDLFRRAWSVLSDTTPWYPRTKVVGKDGRPWEAVFAEIRDLLPQIPRQPRSPSISLS